MTNKKKIIKETFSDLLIPIGIWIVILMIIIGKLCFRFDYASGQHRITPTAIDRDMWGNYKVYYKTNDYTKNSEEDYYYIEKYEDSIISQVEHSIINNKEIVVYYDRYIGYKGISAPETSPIVRIEIFE